MLESGKNSKVRLRLSNSFPVFNNNDNLQSYNSTVTRANNLIDTTDFFSEGFIEKIKGLKSLSGSFDFYFDNELITLNDITGIGAIMNNFFYNNGEKIFIELYYNDYLRIGLEIVISSFSIDASTTNSKTINLSFENNSEQVLLYEVQRTNYDLQDIENYVLMNLTNYEVAYVRDVLPTP